jgi:putative transposase
MPNHFHGIVIIESRDKASLVPTEERRFGKPVAPIWQKNYYEHIIRNEMDLFYIRRYIELNPLK